MIALLIIIASLLFLILLQLFFIWASVGGVVIKIKETSTRTEGLIGSAGLAITGAINELRKDINKLVR